MYALPKVSVIVPVYNVARFLPQCLDSIVGQTLKDIEIICVNDGSSDDSLAVLQEYASRDERISIIDKANSGYGHTMNVGMQKARGEYIGILESDDFTAVDMFEQLYQTAAACRADIVKANYWEYRGETKTFVRMLGDGPYGRVFNPRRDNRSVFYNQPAIWTAIYRWKFLEENKISFNETPGASYQDTSFNFMALACAERVVLKEEAYVCYRRDNESSSVNSAGKVYCVLDEYENSRAFMKSRPKLAAELAGLLPVLAWNTSQWNYDRIAVSFKYDFLARLVSVFADLWNEGEICPRQWLDKSRLEDVLRIMMDKDSFLYEAYGMLQKGTLLSAALEHEICSHDRVYLYGAGKIGCEMAAYLQEHSLEFDGFIVADKKGNPPKMMGKEIFSLDEISEEAPGNDLILLTVKEATQREVMPLLRKKGFRDVVLLRQEMRECLLQFGKYSIHQVVQHVFEK